MDERCNIDVRSEHYCRSDRGVSLLTNLTSVACFLPSDGGLFLYHVATTSRHPGKAKAEQVVLNPVELPPLSFLASYSSNPSVEQCPHADLGGKHCVSTSLAGFEAFCC